MKNLFLLSAFIFNINLTNAQWQPTNGPYGGQINCFAINGPNIFAGTDGAGVFLSTDSGMTWKSVNNGLGNPFVTALAISGTTIFAGTSSGQAPLFKSTDNGNTWSTANNGLPNNVWVSSIAVIGTSIFVGNGFLGGVYFSSDNGNSWVAKGLSSIRIATIAINGSTIFAGTNGHGLYISSDNGNTWTLSSLTTNFNAAYSLAFSGTNTFAGTDDGVFTSTDNGISWAAASNGMPAYTDVYSLAVHGSDLFAGGWGGVFLSNNNGTSWDTIRNNMSFQVVNALALSGSDIIAGTRMGVFFSNNNGNSWMVRNNGISNTEISVISSTGTTLFAGTQGNGMFISNDNGTTWSDANNGLTLSGRNINAIAVRGSEAFAGTDDGVFLSTDTGKSWSSVNNNLGGYKHIHSLAINGTNLFAGAEDFVYLSTNSGSSWSVKNTGLYSTPVISLASTGTNVFAGTRDGAYMFYSSDNGAHWVQQKNGLPMCSSPNSCPIWSIAFKGTDVYAGTDEDLYLSVNNGSSWVSQGLPNERVGSVFISDANVFASTAGDGIFLSSTSGNWNNISNGLPYYSYYLPHYIYTSDFDTLGTNMFLGTKNGVWRRPLSEMVCSATFSVEADTSQLHHYLITYNGYGTTPISYDWSWGDGTHDYIPYPSHTYADSGFYDICLSISDFKGCTTTFCDSSFHALRTNNTMVYVNVVNPLTGIKTNLQVPGFIIYPNPSTNKFMISFNKSLTNASLKIFDIMGGEVFSKVISEKQVAVTTKLSPGIYFMKVTDNEKEYLQKLIVE